MIELKSVVKTYKKGQKIGPFSFQMQPGKIVALVGENGAGKSTLIKLIMGQLKADHGEIIGITPQQVRYMPDDLHFPSTLKVVEIMELLGKLKRVPVKRQLEVLQQVDLLEKKNRLVSELSKGMRQRLNFAQSLLGESDLYILDEPTNGLDPYWIAQVKEILQKEKEQGRMILYSTHLLSTVEEIADEVIFIHQGKLLASGSIESLKEQYGETSLETLWLKLFAGGYAS